MAAFSAACASWLSGAQSAKPASGRCCCPVDLEQPLQLSPVCKKWHTLHCHVHCMGYEPVLPAHHHDCRATATSRPACMHQADGQSTPAAIRADRTLGLSNAPVLLTELFQSAAQGSAPAVRRMAERGRPGGHTLMSDQALAKLAVPRKASTMCCRFQPNKALVSS